MLGPHLVRAPRIAGVSGAVVTPLSLIIENVEEKQEKSVKVKQ
jgi:hypothetical protein